MSTITTRLLSHAVGWIEATAIDIFVDGVSDHDRIPIVIIMTSDLSRFRTIPFIVNHSCTASVHFSNAVILTLMISVLIEI